MKKQIYQQIKQKNFDGDFAPSQRLNENGLAQDVEVGRHKVRVALDRLQADGLVKIEPNRGATVKSLELAEVLDSDCSGGVGGRGGLPGGRAD